MHRSAFTSAITRQQARIAVRRAAPRGREQHHLLVQAAHDGRVGSLVCPVQQQRGMRQPGDDAAGDHVQRPGAALPATVAGDPFAHELARQGLDVQRTRPPPDGAASRSRAARAPSPHWVVRSRTASGRAAERRSRPDRTCRRRSHRPGSGPACADPAARSAAPRRPPGDAASRSSVSGAGTAKGPRRGPPDACRSCAGVV